MMFFFSDESINRLDKVLTSQKERKFNRRTINVSYFSAKSKIGSGETLRENNRITRENGRNTRGNM